VCFVDPLVPKCLKLDPTRIKQILNNLLLNAIKFSAHNIPMNRVDIECYYYPEVDNLQFSVIDFGIPISDADKVQLFHQFKTLESARALGLAGSGLGLYICKSLCQAMSGSIKLLNHLDPDVGVNAFVVNIKAHPCEESKTTEEVVNPDQI